MRSHGMNTVTLDRHKGHAFSYDVLELGFNYRIDEVRSSIGIVQLEKLASFNAARKELYQVYCGRLKDVRGVKLPVAAGGDGSSHHIFPVVLDEGVNRQEVMQCMREKGIQTSIHYPPIHLFDFYRRTYGYRDGLLPVTENVAGRELTLPLYPSMTADTVYYVCDVLEQCLRKAEEPR